MAAKKPSAAPASAAPAAEDLDLTSAYMLIKEFEGMVPYAYWDATGKVWTIGYGTTKYPNGQPVKKGDKCTRAQAVEWMENDVKKIRVPAILSMVKRDLTNPELCALVSFAYNVGVGSVTKGGGLGGSTLLRKWNAGESKIRVADEFNKWIKSGGRVLSGLVRRRKAERELFLTEPIGEVTPA